MALADNMMVRQLGALALSGVYVANQIQTLLHMLVMGLVYTLDAETMAMTRGFLLVLSVTIVGTAYQMSCLTGIVCAAGATHFVLVNDLI